MDFTQMIGLAYISAEKVSFKNAFAFGLFFPIRQVLQGAFMMRRLDTWTWFDSGFFSITVPWHDTNDFYYSGHLGTCVLWGIDYYSNDYQVMAAYSLFNLFF